MKNQYSKNEFEKGSLKEVAFIAWPIVVSMLSYTAMGVADTLFVGWLGITALAAVGVSTTAIFTVNAFFVGTLHAVKIAVAQATGAGRYHKAIRLGWLGVLMALPLGMAVIALGYLDEQIFAILGGSEEMQLSARVYFGIRVLGAPLFYVLISISDFYQGRGDTKTPMKVNLLVNALNIVFDLVLIFGFGPIPALGIAGAAWATILAIVIGSLIIFRTFYMEFGFPDRVERDELIELLKLGIPIGVRYLLGVGGFAFFTAIVSRMGEAEMAANQIAIKIVSISFLPGYGISEAISVLAGQYVGANDYDSARRAYKNALKLSLGVMTLFGVIFWFFPIPLIHIFQNESAVVSIASDLLIIAALFQIFDSITMTASGALNGTGDTTFTMYVSIIGTWLILVPASYLLGVSFEFGVQGAWTAMLVEMFVVGGIFAWRFSSDRWEESSDRSEKSSDRSEKSSKI